MKRENAYFKNDIAAVRNYIGFYLRGNGILWNTRFYSFDDHNTRR